MSLSSIDKYVHIVELYQEKGLRAPQGLTPREVEVLYAFVQKPRSNFSLRVYACSYRFFFAMRYPNG